MTEKSNKQKCLEMWEWLAENPSWGKDGYCEHLAKHAREDEYSFCAACAESYDQPGFDSSDCGRTCPITWVKGVPASQCHHALSPYLYWSSSTSKGARREAALEIVELIKTTWKED